MKKLCEVKNEEKRKKNRLQELRRRVEETTNNPRFIELKEKKEKYLAGECEMSPAEMNELTDLYNENTKAMIEETKFLIADTKRLLGETAHIEKTEIIFCIITVGICVLGLILNALR